VGCRCRCRVLGGRLGRTLRVDFLDAVLESRRDQPSATGPCLGPMPGPSHSTDRIFRLRAEFFLLLFCSRSCERFYSLAIAFLSCPTAISSRSLRGSFSDASDFRVLKLKCLALSEMDDGRWTQKVADAKLSVARLCPDYYPSTAVRSYGTRICIYCLALRLRFANIIYRRRQD
jgi:hypothetical protein